MSGDISDSHDGQGSVVPSASNGKRPGTDAAPITRGVAPAAIIGASVLTELRLGNHD